MSETEKTLNNLKEKYEEIKKETKIVLEPGEQLLLCLKTPKGLSLFLKFLESEYNQENLQALLDVINLNLCLNLTDSMTKEIKNKIYNFTIKYLPILNIEAKELVDLKKECETIQKWEYIDNIFFRELFKNLEGSLRINLLDPFLRFQKNEQEILNSYTTMFRNKANKIDINDKKGVILNNFEKWPDNLPIRGALHVAQDILYYFIETFNNTSHWSVSSSKVLLNIEKLEQNLKLLTFKQKTLELTKVSLKDLSDKEKLNFYVNTYNIMMIHAFLYQIPFKSEKKEQEEFRKKVKYIIDGKEISLQDVLNLIEKLYSSMTTGYIEIIQFSLVHFRSTSSQIKVLYHENDILEEIERNCKKFLKENIEFHEIESTIGLPNVQYFFKTKKKPKKSNRKNKFESNDIKFKNLSYSAHEKEPTTLGDIKRYQSSGPIKKLGQIEIETNEEVKKSEEKGKLLSKIRKSNDSPKGISGYLDFDPDKVKITHIPSPKMRDLSQYDNLLSPKKEQELVSPKRPKDVRDEFSAKDLLSNKKDGVRRKSLGETVSLKFGEQFHSGNSIDQDLIDMYDYILEKELTHFQMIEWVNCKSFISKKVDSDETDWICLLNNKNRKDAMSQMLEDNFFE